MKLDIDPGMSLRKVDKIGFYTKLLQTFFNFPSGKSGYKPKGSIVDSQLF